MRADIHPNYRTVTFNCSCGNVLSTRSALSKDTMSIDVCAKCHPFYTGQQKNSDVGGRIDKFNKRFAMARAVKREPEAE